jgi:stress-induced-phosphoprotein 1
MRTAADEPETAGFGKLFADPNLLGKLATNPKTQKYLADPAFVQKVHKWRSHNRFACFSNTPFYRYR